jgi:hypothetical protein
MAPIDHSKSSKQALATLAIAAAGIGGYLHFAHQGRKFLAVGAAGFAGGALMGVKMKKLGLAVAGIPLLHSVLGECGVVTRPGWRAGAVTGAPAPWSGPQHQGPPPPAPESPCPPGQMWDVNSQNCVPEPLPWLIGPRTGYHTGLTWEEMEQETPDLRAARRAGQAAWHGLLTMPGPFQWAYKTTKSLMGDGG